MRGLCVGILLAVALAGCAGAQTAAVAPTPTFIVVRHAEKADASRDPALSPAGQARAARLARHLAATPLAAAYATTFQRTRQTLEPVARAQGVPVTVYDPAQPAPQFAARLKAEHPAGTVLVAGHSNTVPAIVAALCDCTVAPMDDAEYDRLSIVRAGPDGRPVLEVSRYGNPP